jgi:2'-5' RNA ligase
MSDRCRAFFGLPLPEPAMTAVTDAARALERAAGRQGIVARWSRFDQLHATLKFLGWIPRDTIDRYREIAERHAAERPPIDVELGEVAVFGSASRARVLIVRIADPGRSIGDLAGAIEADAEELGVPREERPFVPHVTLARFKQSTDARPVLARAALAPVKVRFSSMRFYESVLTPEGGRYTVLHEARFARPSAAP